MTKIFPDPASPFHLEHNQSVFQERVAGGKLLAFENPDGGIVYATPDKAIELVSDGYRQMTLDELKAHHQRVMQNY